MGTNITTVLMKNCNLTTFVSDIQKAYHILFCFKSDLEDISLFSLCQEEEH
jgi:hypothetical protein